jgi:hypothetical protein
VGSVLSHDKKPYECKSAIACQCHVPNRTAMIKFALSEVSPGTAYERVGSTASIHALLDKRVEALSCSSGELVSCDTTHAFVKAAHDAFYDHHPLVIRPDDIWFCIAQGFVTHSSVTISDHKAGINPYVVFPADCNASGDSIGLSHKWLVANWSMWVWPQGSVEDVWLRSSLSSKEL